MRHGLQTGCLVLGCLCLIYYIAIVIYVGIAADFAWIWALGAAVLLLLNRSLAYTVVHPGTALRYVNGAVLVLLGVALVLVFTVGGRIVGAMVDQPQEKLDYVIVLGAQVRGTKPSRALRKRLDRAIAYAEANPETVFILSGGQGPDEGVSEAACMYEYMTDKGLAAVRLVMEDQSTSTRENLQYSAKLLDREQDTVGILSNNFHIYRALLLARDEGYQKVCGIPAPSDIGMQPHYILREVCAVLAGKVLRR